LAATTQRYADGVRVGVKRFICGREVLGAQDGHVVDHLQDIAALDAEVEQRRVWTKSNEADPDGLAILDDRYQTRELRYSRWMAKERIQ